MSEVVLYIATSLDGFIARSDGNLDWLNSIASSDKTDYGYADFLSSIGTTIMGRKTYNEIINFDIEWPYTDISSYIATTNSSLEIVSPNSFIIQDDIATFTTNLKQQTEKDIWLIGGGELITYFLNNNLIDKMILSIVPIILGNGIPLFPNNPNESIWSLLKFEHFDTGVVSLTYEKKKS